MLTKKDFQSFADALSMINNQEEREKVIRFLCPTFRGINWRFDEGRFKEWIKRRVNGENTKGLG